jgi:hypothetical protein
MLASLGLLPAGASQPIGQGGPDRDAAPNGSSVTGPLDLGDVLATFNVEAVTVPPANVSLGVEFARDHYWVSGRSLDDNIKKLYKLASDGNFVAEYVQDNCGGSTFGYRDGAFDGTYLYFADECGIDQIDPETGARVGGMICPPAVGSVCRALAFDPASGNFWTANFASNIYEFDRNGNVINSFPNSLNVYGAGWDDLSFGGPYLWVWSQDGTPAVLATQLDPTNGQPTGINFQGSDDGGNAIAGGADFDFDAIDGKTSLVTMHQADTDTIVVYEIYNTPTSVTVSDFAAKEANPPFVLAGLLVLTAIIAAAGAMVWRSRRQRV